MFFHLLLPFSHRLIGKQMNTKSQIGRLTSIAHFVQFEIICCVGISLFLKLLKQMTNAVALCIIRINEDIFPEYTKCQISIVRIHFVMGISIVFCASRCFSLHFSMPAVTVIVVIFIIWCVCVCVRCARFFSASLKYHAPLFGACHFTIYTINSNKWINRKFAPKRGKRVENVNTIVNGKQTNLHTFGE